MVRESVGFDYFGMVQNELLAVGGIGGIGLAQGIVEHRHADRFRLVLAEAESVAERQGRRAAAFLRSHPGKHLALRQAHAADVALAPSRIRHMHAHHADAQLTDGAVSPGCEPAHRAISKAHQTARLGPRQHLQHG